MRTTFYKTQKSNNQFTNKIYFKLKSIFLIFVFIIFSTSCSKDENPQVINPSIPQFRVKEVFDVNNLITEKFTYNSENLVTRNQRFDNDTDEYFTYNSQGYLINEVVRINSTQVAILFVEYVYDANNAVKEKIETDYLTTKTTKKVFTNNTAKRPLTSTEYELDTLTQVWSVIDGKSNNYTYDANNLLIVDESDEFKYNYTYDSNGNKIESKKYNKSNIPVIYLLIEKIIYTYNNVKPAYFLNSRLSKNQITKRVTEKYDDGLFIESKTTEISYIYNAQNYITKATTLGGTVFNFNLEKIN